MLRHHKMIEEIVLSWNLFVCHCDQVDFKWDKSDIAIILAKDVQKALFIGILNEKRFQVKLRLFSSQHRISTNLKSKLLCIDPVLLNLAGIIFLDVYSKKKQLFNFLIFTIVIRCVHVCKIWLSDEECAVFSLFHMNPAQEIRLIKWAIRIELLIKILDIL